MAKYRDIIQNHSAYTWWDARSDILSSGPYLFLVVNKLRGVVVYGKLTTGRCVLNSCKCIKINGQKFAR